MNNSYQTQTKLKKECVSECSMDVQLKGDVLALNQRLWNIIERVNERVHLLLCSDPVFKKNLRKRPLKLTELSISTTLKLLLRHICQSAQSMIPNLNIPESQCQGQNSYINMNSDYIVRFHHQRVRIYNHTQQKENENFDDKIYIFDMHCTF